MNRPTPEQLGHALDSEEFGDRPFAAFHVLADEVRWLHANVAELVKAARGAAEFLADGAADECDIAEALREALKSFER